MLYGKIYLDKDKGGQEMLAFAALAVKGAEESRAFSVDHIAISPEARAALLARINRSDRVVSRYSGDFELYGDDDSWEHGSFRFVAHDERDGVRYRTLRDSDPLLLMLSKGGCRRAVLDYMVPCENETLKRLDLTERLDEGELWARHFAAMRARGEEPAADTDTIRRTPTAFLTDAQREVIRREYDERCEEVGDYHMHKNTEAATDLVVGELMKLYRKSGPDISAIVGLAAPVRGALTFGEALEMIEEEFPVRKEHMHAYSIFVDRTYDGYNFFFIELRDDGEDEDGLFLSDGGSACHSFEEVEEAEWKSLCREHGFTFRRWRIRHSFTGMEDLYAFIEFLDLIADTYDPIEDEDEEE